MRVILVTLVIVSFVACEKKEPAAGSGPAPAEVGSAPAGAAGPGGSGSSADQAGAIAAGRAGQAVAAGEQAAAAGAAAAEQAAAAATQAGSAALAAGDRAADRAATAADQAVGAAAQATDAAGRAAVAAGRAAQAGVAAAAAAASTPPADFPLPVPPDARGTFSQRSSGGRSTRSAIFSCGGSADELAAGFEKAMTDQGLEPERKKTTLGASQVISIKAGKGDTEAKAVITTASSGTNQVSVVWREPVR